MNEKVTFDNAWVRAGVAISPPSSDKQMTRSAGYMTVRQQVQAMQAAGQQLMMARAERYNTAQEIEDPDFFNGIPERYQHLMTGREITFIRDVVHTWRRNELAARQMILQTAEMQKKNQDSSLTQDPSLVETLSQLRAEIEQLRSGSPVRDASKA